MMKAIEIAKGKIRGNEYPFGCCIVYQDTVILEQIHASQAETVKSC